MLHGVIAVVIIFHCVMCAMKYLYFSMDIYFINVKNNIAFVSTILVIAVGFP